MRETIAYILLLILIAFASFEAGLIYENRRKENTRARVDVLSKRINDLHGEIIILKGPPTQAKPKK